MSEQEFWQRVYIAAETAGAKYPSIKAWKAVNSFKEKYSYFKENQDQ